MQRRASRRYGAGNAAVGQPHLQHVGVEIGERKARVFVDADRRGAGLQLGA
jgi:hypothetical protein